MFFKSVWIAAMLLLPSGSLALAASIEDTLSAYETALNAYADDGIFMAQHSEAHIGRQAIREAYIGVFDTIALDIVFDIHEVLMLSADWAAARTSSRGQVRVIAPDIIADEANQELFLLRRDDAGDWKIARYIFTTTNPPRP